MNTPWQHLRKETNPSLSGTTIHGPQKQQETPLIFLEADSEIIILISCVVGFWVEVGRDGVEEEDGGEFNLWGLLVDERDVRPRSSRGLLSFAVIKAIVVYSKITSLPIFEPHHSSSHSKLL